MGSASPQGHHTPEDTGALAARARVGRRVIHVGPTHTPEAATARAVAAFGGRTECPRDDFAARSAVEQRGEAVCAGRSARRGQYRVIYSIHDEEILVRVVRISHRADAHR